MPRSRTEMAAPRTEMADLRTELRTDMADVRTEIAHATTSQTWRLATFIGTWSVLLVTLTALLR